MPKTSEYQKQADLEKLEKKAAKRRQRIMERPMQSSQKLIPVREIRNGIVITTDNRYIKIIEVFPTNFLLKSAAEQNAIVHMFRSLFKAGPSTIQFKVISIKANMQMHLDILKEEMLSETSDECFQIQKEYATLLRDVGQNEGITRRFFLSFEYERQSNIFQKPTFGEIKGQIDTTTARIINSLQDCGNEVALVEDPNDPQQYNEQTMEILYSLLNRRMAEKVPFEKRMASVIRRYNAYGDRWSGYIPPGEFIAPHQVEFLERDYCVIDGKYYTYAYIPTNGYNPYVTASWTSTLINAGAGIDVNIYFSRIPKEHISFRLRQSINQNRAAMMDTNDTQANYESLADTINSGMYIKNAMAGGEDFYYMTTMLTISGDSRAEIDWKFNEMKKMLITMDIGLKRCTWDIEEAFKSSLPFARVSERIQKKAKRNILTSGAAASYPFTSFEMCDRDGILLGRNAANNTLAILDIFNTKVYKNANMFICGTTGAGKTFTLLLLAMRMRIKHIPVFLIAPEKEHEFERVCAAMGGQFIRFGSGSPHRINILDIFMRDDTASILLDGGTIVSSRLAEKVQDLKTFFKLLVPDITYEEKELLDEALIEVYNEKGITMDNESLWDPDNPGSYREMPVLKDLYDNLRSKQETQRIANILNMLVKGSGSSFNGHTNVNLDNEFVVLGLEHLNEDLLPVGMYMAIDYAWSKIKEDRTKKKAMFIDEWWRFAFDPLAADYSLKIAKTVRAYGGSLVLATQQMTDIFAIEGGKYGEGVLNNCKTKIIMQLEEADAASVQRILNLTANERTKITRFRQGEGLLVANNNSICISFESNQTEFDLITTDRSALEKQILNMMTEEEKANRLARRRREVEKMMDTFDISEEADLIIQEKHEENTYSGMPVLETFGMEDEAELVLPRRIDDDAVELIFDRKEEK